MQDDKRTRKIIYIIGIIPIIWFALLIAPYLSGGLIEIIKNLHSMNLTLSQISQAVDMSEAEVQKIIDENM